MKKKIFLLPLLGLTLTCALASCGQKKESVELKYYNKESKKEESIAISQTNDADEVVRALDAVTYSNYKADAVNLTSFGVKLDIDVNGTSTNESGKMVGTADFKAKLPAKADVTDMATFLSKLDVSADLNLNIESTEKENDKTVNNKLKLEGKLYDDDHNFYYDGKFESTGETPISLNGKYYYDLKDKLGLLFGLDKDPENASTFAAEYGAMYDKLVNFNLHTLYNTSTEYQLLSDYVAAKGGSLKDLITRYKIEVSSVSNGQLTFKFNPAFVNALSPEPIIKNSDLAKFKEANCSVSFDVKTLFVTNLEFVAKMTDTTDSGETMNYDINFKAQFDKDATPVNLASYEAFDNVFPLEQLMN